MQQLTEFQVRLAGTAHTDFFRCSVNALTLHKPDFDVNNSGVHHYRWMRSTPYQRWGLWLEVLCTGQCVETLIFFCPLAWTHFDPLFSLIVQWHLP